VHSGLHSTADSRHQVAHTRTGSPCYATIATAQWAGRARHRYNCVTSQLSRSALELLYHCTITVCALCQDHLSQQGFLTFVWAGQHMVVLSAAYSLHAGFRKQKEQPAASTRCIVCRESVAEAACRYMLNMSTRHALHKKTHPVMLHRSMLLHCCKYGGCLNLLLALANVQHMEVPPGCCSWTVYEPSICKSRVQPSQVTWNSLPIWC
jgi:hypothetical protein